MAVQATTPSPGTISTIAGASLNSGPATTVPQQPWGVAVFGSTLYLSDQNANVVRAVDINTGLETVVATGPLTGPRGLAVDSTGNLYIMSTDHVVMVTPAGAISTLAAGFSYAFGVATDAAGDVFVADTGHNQIQRIDHGPLHTVTTVAGTGAAGSSPDGTPAISAKLSGPEGVAVDSAGANLWIADTGNWLVREVVGGTINTVAGGGSTPGCAAGTATSVSLILPSGVWVDGSGNVFIADQNHQCVREVIGTNIATVAGTGTVGYSGDGGPATAAKLAYPTTVTTDGSGNMFFADNLSYRVRKVTSGGIITTIAGTGTLGGCTLNGDGDQATSILLCDVSGIAVDSSGDVFFSDGLMNVVRKVTPAGVLSTAAGNGTQGHSGDNGPATAAQLNYPGALAIDAAGDLLIVERALPATIRRVDPAGTITSPVPSSFSSLPQAIAVAANGIDFYVADTYGGVVDKVTVGSPYTVARVAGGGTNFPGDGGLATNAKLYTPSGVAVDGSGNLYIADPGGSRLYKVDAGGIITTVAVFGTSGGPSSVEIAPTGQIVVPAAAGRLVSLTSAGQIPIAGNGSGTFSGDGGPAYLAGVWAGPFAFDAAGDIFVADGSIAYVGRIRRIQAFAAPSAPVSVSAAPNIHSATVQWSAPAGTGGLPVAQYTVRSYQGATPGPSVVTGATTAIVGGLAANVPYTFTVSAFNGWTSGPASAPSAPVTPMPLTTLGDIITYAGSVGAGPATSLGQDPFSVAVAGTHLYVGDFANPVVRDVDLGSGQEGVLAGNDGYGYSGDGGPATSAMIQAAGAMVHCGNDTYIADSFNYVIRKIDSAGKITTVAGNGTFGYSGDGGPAIAAQIGTVFGLACQPGAIGPTAAFLYITEADNGTLRVVDGSGNISTLIRGLAFPTAVLTDPAANVYLSDSGSSTVYRVDGISHSLTTFAGTGVAGFSGDRGPATSAQLNDPWGLAFTYAAGGTGCQCFIEIADRHNDRIRIVDQNGVIDTMSSNGYPFFLSGPVGLASAIGTPGTTSGIVYVADFNNFTVHKIDMSTSPWLLTTVAGNRTLSWSGDGGAANQAQLGNPYAVAVDSSGDLFIADNQNSAIREVSPTGVIRTIAGNGIAGYTGDGGLATAAELNFPRGVAVAPNGDVYISDTLNQALRKVDHSTGFISTVVANLHFPRGVAVDAAGNVYIADTGVNEVLLLRPDGSVPVFAGTGTAGFSGDGGPATSAQLKGPRGLAIDVSSNVYISDSDNNRVRRVDHATGNISTVAGNGTAGMGGDGHAALSAQLNFPFGLAVDSTGDLFIVDASNNRVRVVDTHGNIDTMVAACGAFAGFSGDGGPASFAEVNVPYGVAVDAFGDLFIADVFNNRVRGVAGVVGTRYGSCPGPTGTAGGRDTKPSGSSPVSPPLPRIADIGSAPHKLTDVVVPPGRASSVPAQPSVVVPKHPFDKPPAAAPRAPAAAQAPASGPAQARGRAPTTVVMGRSQPSSSPWGALWSLFLVVPVAFLTLVVTLFRRRRTKPLKS